MAEWSIAAVLKTVVLRGTGGSNPSLSAKKNCKFVTYSSFLYKNPHLGYSPNRDQRYTIKNNDYLMRVQ